MPHGSIHTPHSMVRDSEGSLEKQGWIIPWLFEVKVINERILVNSVKSGGQISQKVGQIVKWSDVFPFFAANRNV